MCVVGNIYTHRETIYRFGGGLTQAYLPTRNNYRDVLGGRFKLDLNPRAPNVVVVGDTVQITKQAEAYASCGYAIPIFVKVRTNEWRYEGTYLCTRQSSTALDLARYASHRKDATSILFLEKVP